MGKKMKAFQMDSSTLVPDTFKKKMFQMLQFSKRFGKLVDGKKLVNPFLKSVENLLMENSQKAALFYLASSFRGEGLCCRCMDKGLSQVIKSKKLLENLKSIML